MASLQFPITGMQYKHFDDGVDIAVEYIRNNSNIRIIKTIRYYYNLESMEVDYNCSYIDFIHSHPKVRISKNMIDVAPRVRQMMDELESELRSVDRLPSLTDIESSIDIGYDDITADEGHIFINASDFTARAITTIQIESESSIEKPAPKRQRTRWELLELD